ncbi:MAG: sulfurtransferase [Magnetococcales bacterium]|nr:sulfurtransferase [Magnetococcales bacterium]
MSLSSTDAHAATDSGFPGVFVDADWLAQHIDEPDLKVFQVGGDLYYHRFHIPGAPLFPYKEILGIREGVSGMRADRDHLARVFGNMGIGPDTRVVAYDLGGGTDAARLIWTLASMGHHKGAILDGGLGGWLQADRPQEHHNPRLQPTEFQANPDTRWEVDWQELQALSEKQGETLVIDTRTQKEYVGMTLKPPRGHIPGAVHLDWTETLVAPRTPLLRSREELLARYAELGAKDLEIPIIVYCLTGHRAAQSWALLRHLGFKDVRLYDGSMMEWGMRNLPVVQGEKSR